MINTEIRMNNMAAAESDLSSLLSLTAEFGTCEPICLSQDPSKKKIGSVIVYPR